MDCRLEIESDAFLRLLNEGDARELHGLIEANRTYLARWMPWALNQTFTDTLGFIHRTRDQLGTNDGFQAAIVSADRIIGVIGFHGVNWDNRSTRLGYWLAEDHQGKGTMTNAVRVLVDHALSVWELKRVEIDPAVENCRSRAIPERLNFQEEGTLRQAERVGGRYLDTVMYSMLAAEWRRHRRIDGGPFR